MKPNLKDLYDICREYGVVRWADLRLFEAALRSYVDEWDNAQVGDTLSKMPIDVLKEVLGDDV